MTIKLCNLSPEQAEIQKEKSKAYIQGWRAANKDKVKATSRRYRDNNLEKVRERDREASFKKLYGLTIAERDQMLADQGGECAACGSRNPASKLGWHTDHCHKSEKVRGILCANCNTALGHAKDSVDRLRLLISYLERHQ
jgi:hypothetical protein